MVVRGAIEEDEGVVGEVIKIGRRRLDAIMQRQNGEATLEDTGWLAGYLYLLRVLDCAFPNGKSTTTTIREIIDQVVNTILTCKEIRNAEVTAENLDLLMGVATQVVLSKEQNYTEGLRTLIFRIVGLQDQEMGSWGPSTAFIINSLQVIKPYLPADMPHWMMFDDERARYFLLEHDIRELPPTMENHGLVMKALAFTDPDDIRFYDILREVTNESLDETRPGWKKDAGIKDEWVGLRTGEAGRAWLWAVAELSLKKDEVGNGMLERCILGYNDV